MKKIILLIVLACYFVVTCGVVINSHYCMDRLASTSFFDSGQKKCGLCGMEIHESNGCCRDEFQLLKLSDDQQKNLLVSYEIPELQAVVTTPSAFLVAEFENVFTQRHFHNLSPPLLVGDDIYLQNNVFRI